MSVLRRLLRGGAMAFIGSGALACAQGTDDGTVSDLAAGDAGGDAQATDGSSGGGRSDAGGVDAAADDGGGCAGKVVINELMSDGTSGTDEFIELYNSSACAVALASWKLRYESGTGTASVAPIYTFPGGRSIAPKGFVVIAGAAFQGAKDGTLTSGLGKTDGQVALENDQGVIVDGLGYGTITGGTYREKAAAPSPDQGASIARKADGLDTDDNSADFHKTAPHSAGKPNP